MFNGLKSRIPFGCSLSIILDGEKLIQNPYKEYCKIVGIPKREMKKLRKQLISSAYKSIEIGFGKDKSLDTILFRYE